MFSGSVILRSTLLWSAVSAGTAGVGLLTAPALTDPGGGFVGILTFGCAAAAVLAAVCLWAVATEVVLGVLTGRQRDQPAGPVGPLRALVMAACGVAALGTPATAAPDGPDTGRAATVAATSSDEDAAGKQRALDGLPLPDRPSSDAVPEAAPVGPVGPVGPVAPATPVPERPGYARPPDRVVVQSGDNLWQIAEARLPDAASGAEVASYTRALHARNADVIGADPDLIHPGQVLDLPRPDERSR